MSAIEENKAIVRRFFEEAWNEKKIADLHQYWSDNNVHHFGMTERAAGPDVAKQVMETWWTAFPDFRYNIGALIAEDDLVAARVTFSGTHTGVFRLGSRTITPTNKPLCDPEMFVFRTTDGKIVESWSTWESAERAYPARSSREMTDPAWQLKAARMGGYACWGAPS